MFNIHRSHVILSGLLAALLQSSPALAAEGAHAPASSPTGTLRLVVPADRVQRTGVTLTLTEVRGGATSTQQIIAILIGLLSAPSIEIRGQAGIPARAVSLPNGRRAVEVSLQPLLADLASQGVRVTQIQASDPPGAIALPAEGVWVGLGPFGHWECALEDADVDWCNELCGGEANVESLTTEPEIPSNNPFIEPACKTTCKCTEGHGSGGTNLDPPAFSGLDG